MIVIELERRTSTESSPARRGWATFDLGSLTHVLTRGRAAADGMHFATS